MRPHECHRCPPVCRMGTLAVACTVDPPAGVAKQLARRAVQGVVLVTTGRGEEVRRLAFVRDLPDARRHKADLLRRELGEPGLKPRRQLR